MNVFRLLQHFFFTFFIVITKLIGMTIFFIVFFFCQILMVVKLECMLAGYVFVLGCDGDVCVCEGG